MASNVSLQQTTAVIWGGFTLSFIVYGSDDLDCIFCKIIAGEIPSYKVYEDDYSLAFLDISPITKGHSLVLPKTHVPKLSSLEDDYLSGLMIALKKMARAVEDALQPEGLNVFINQGEVAGQVVPHLHIHLVPRTTGDGLEFITPSAEMTEEEFNKISRKISNLIKV
jgi:histidine triad (HIT) family protein